MKHIFTCIILILFITTTSCEEECGECFSPPAPFIFELVNAQGENVFTIEAFDQNQLRVEEASNGQRVNYTFISENDLNVIEINSIGWTTEQVELSFQLDENEVFTFKVDAERMSEDCCTFTRYSNISLEGANFELDEQTGTYRVTIG